MPGLKFGCSMKRGSGIESNKRRFAIWVMIPICLLYLVLRIIPILGTFYLSFFEWNIIKLHHPFVGLENFARILEDKTFGAALANTMLFTVFTVVISVTLALILALALKKKTRLGGFYEFAYFLPVIIPMVPVSIIWKWMYDKTYGIINYFLSFLGLPAIGWLTEPNLALTSIIIMSIWKSLGYYMILFLVGLRNIPEQYYEAAMVDGANKWQVFRNITFPLLKRMTLYVSVIATIQALNVFTQVYVMTTGSQGAPAAAVRVLVYEIYQNGFRYFKMGYASAQVLVLFVIVMIISLIQFKLLSKWYHLILLGGVVIMFFPFIWMFLSAFKTEQEILTVPPTILPLRSTLVNYFNVCHIIPVFRYLGNSLFVASISTIIVLITSALAGMVFAKYSFPFKNILFIIILGTTMVPFECYMIPFYLMISKAGLIDTYTGIITPLVITSFGVFLMRQHVATIPDDLLDAARIDGCNELRIFWNIIIPLSGSALAALAIFNFMFSWGFFVWPLIITNTAEKFVMEVGLTIFQNDYTTAYGSLMAGTSLSVIPITLVFMIFRRHIISGMAMSGMKS
jgi:multiple sugar transport system permease protein